MSVRIGQKDDMQVYRHESPDGVILYNIMDGLGSGVILTLDEAKELIRIIREDGFIDEGFHR